MEKLMSLSLSEFHRSLARLVPELEIAPDQRRFEIAVGGGHVTIDAEVIDGARLSGLLELPRCRVHFTFSGMSDQAQQSFIARFDLAFQRGGG